MWNESSTIKRIIRSLRKKVENKAKICLIQIGPLSFWWLRGFVASGGKAFRNHLPTFWPPLNSLYFVILAGILGK